MYLELAKVDPDNHDGFVPFDQSGDPCDAGALPMPLSEMRVERVDHVDPER